MKLPDLTIVESVVVNARLCRNFIIGGEEIQTDYLIRHLELIEGVTINDAPFVRDFGLALYRFAGTIPQSIIRHLVSLNVLSIVDDLGTSCAPQNMCNDHRIYAGPEFPQFMEQLRATTEGKPGEKPLEGRRVSLAKYHRFFPETQPTAVDDRQLSLSFA